MNQRRARTGFVGRRNELAVFRETFARDPEEADFPFLFHVRGNGGVGKSTLVRQWEATAREQASVVTAYVDDDVHDAIEAMEAVSVRLGRQGHPLRKFDKQLSTYRQRRHQADSAASAPQPEGGEPGAVAAVASPSSTVAAQVGLAGLGALVPGAGLFTGAVDPQQVARGADRVRAMLNTRLRSHDDVQLVMNPLVGLAPVFLDDLADVAERCERVVLFFDVYERTGPVLDHWLRTIVFGEEYGSLPVNVQIVLAGQLRLDTRVWGDRLGQVTEVCLEVFSEEEARTLLSTHGVTDEPGIELVLRLSGRLPLLVDMLARSDPGAGAAMGDPSETAVERFLKWEQAPERREAAMACALPLQLDEDIYRAVVPEAAAEGYAWLRGLAFVSPQAGRCRYHDVVRAAMLRLRRTRSPVRWQEAHTRLAELFARRRRAVEADLGADPEDLWKEAAWREHRLNETYHRLCAHPRTALPDALFQSASAVGVDIATLRRWAQILGGAGRDTDAAALISWGDRLEAAAEQEQPGAVVLTLLLDASELDARGRAVAYTVRAEEHRHVGDNESALADCEAAVALAPDMARPRAGLGETYRVMGRYEEAVAECTRAVEIDPGYVLAYGSRGDAYRNLGRHEEAFADFARAIEIDRRYAWAYGSRARVYEALERYEEALADYDRAIGIDPLYEWAIGSRAQLHERMGRYEEALAGYSRAVEIDPQYAWAYGSRARAYEALDRREEALADYDRAIGIDPLYEWAVGSRAELHERMGRHEEALAGYSRAVEIDPQYAWAYGSRAQVYEALDRREEALADYDRAVEIDPRYAWALARRARVEQAMGRYEEALADYTRAAETRPESAWWPLDGRAQVQVALGRYEEALADYTRALGLRPGYDVAATHRGELYERLGRYEEALADFTRAVEIDPASDWALNGRTRTFLRMGRYEEALADCARADGIDPGDGWNQMLHGIVLRAAGDPQDAQAYFARALRIFTAARTTDGGEDVDAHQGLLVLHCALLEGDRAAARCGALVALGPDQRQLRDTLDDLAFLREVFPEAGQVIGTVVRRLREAL
ncbi:tetratricopeptide repeat protein [Streptomyces sp. NBC_01460]|uniref:tetratricopeptide repeat protein n=1 Tax=Streptomyces sp. NBC_01460 TaxID=2903875 RepID=UPI002E2F76F7|nr:tetratricopeptide repeat protein [Streptomyces sp. NBC_01460]